MPCSSKWTLSLRFPHALQMPHPFPPPWFDNPHSIWWGLQIMKLLNVLFFSILLFPTSENQIFSLAPHSQKPSAYALLRETPSFTPISNNRQHYRSVEPANGMKLKKNRRYLLTTPGITVTILRILLYIKMLYNFLFHKITVSFHIYICNMQELHLPTTC